MMIFDDRLFLIWLLFLFSFRLDSISFRLDLFRLVLFRLVVFRL